MLALEDGSLYYGTSIGADGNTSGEVVFNTAMTGYQEILTDPSYALQIVTLTYPHIGNTGTNSEDEESSSIQAAGLVIRDLSQAVSSWRNTQSLSDYLRDNDIVAIADIDTRKLTTHLREKGNLAGCILTGIADKKQALDIARSFPGMEGMDLARKVTTEAQYEWREGCWKMSQGCPQISEFKYKVVAYDFGIKRNILRIMAENGCDTTVVPATTPAADVLAMKPDGVFLSNGPGDPEPCDYAIAAIQQLIQAKTPIFGICLGHQLLCLASGANTVKMKFGHHGANHPVLDMKTGKVVITSQNHGFAVDEESLPENLSITHKSLFDDSVQGVERTDCQAFGFQGHPEASPGPHDIAPLFERFITMMENNQ